MVCQEALPVGGSVTGMKLHIKSDSNKVEVGYCYGLVLLKMSWSDIFRLKVGSKSVPKPIANTFFKQ